MREIHIHAYMCSCHLLLRDIWLLNERNKEISSSSDPLGSNYSNPIRVHIFYHIQMYKSQTLFKVVDLKEGNLVEFRIV